MIVRPPAPALRVFHLHGGLRAFDFNKDHFSVGVTSKRTFLSHPNPSYAELPPLLERYGLRIIGIEYFSGFSDEEHMPPDFFVYNSSKGPCFRDEVMAWGRIRHAAVKSKNNLLRQFARDISVYLSLVQIRIFQISEAYNGCYRMKATGNEPLKAELLFSNLWMDTINASLHGFFADAAAARDALGKGIWQQLLGNKDETVLTMTGLMKKTRGSENTLLTQLKAARMRGGWLYTLSELRDHALHVAPMGNQNELTYTTLLPLKLTPILSVNRLKYAVLDRNKALRTDLTSITETTNIDERKRAMSDHKEFILFGHDALELCADIGIKLCELSGELRRYAGLVEEEMVITEADLVGPPVMTIRN